jgi:tight adherence protein C
MGLWDGFIEYISSFGISFRALIDFGKYMPFAVVGMALIGFFYSTIKRSQDEEREKLAKALRKAGLTSNRGVTPEEIAKRLAPEQEEQGTKKFIVSLAEIPLKIAKFDRKETEEKLIQAGDRDPRAISRYILQRGAGMLIAPVIAWIVFPVIGIIGLWQIAGSAVAVLAGGIAVDVRLDRAVKQRRDKLSTELPVLFDLLTIYLEAGQSFDVALSRASAALKTSFATAAEEVDFLRQELELSIDREKTLRSFARRVNSSTAKTFVAVVIQAERRGNAIAPSLRSLSRESRKDVIFEIEKKAQKLPTLMQGPMFIFILPSIFMSVIGPAVIQVISQFGDK